MMIVAITDIHGNITLLERFSTLLTEADLILLTGDITDFGKKPELNSVIEKVNNYKKPVFAVSGNCDFPEVDQALDKLGINIHGECVCHHSIQIIGVGASLVTPFNTPNELSESDYKTLLDKALLKKDPDLPLIFVSHQPPVNTKTDIIRSGIHVGSETIRTFIEKEQPSVCFTGHIHESAAIDTLGKTLIVNPGPLSMGGVAVAKINGASISVDIVTH